MIYGIDAWKPINNAITKYLLSKIDIIISISEITKHRFIEWSHLIQKNSLFF
jgi:hypothetical protein